MRGITTPLAALLSLFLVSAPVSTWACDVSCSSHQTRSDCHASATTSREDRSMPMPPGMDMGLEMGSDQNDSAAGPDTVLDAAPGHSMPMPLQQGKVTRRLERATKTATRTGTLHDHSNGMSSCTHETCTQLSISASPPGANHSQPNFLHWEAVNISSPVNLWDGFHWVRLGTPPPKLLTADRIITTLRI